MVQRPWVTRYMHKNVPRRSEVDQLQRILLRLKRFVKKTKKLPQLFKPVGALIGTLHLAILAFDHIGAARLRLIRSRTGVGTAAIVLIQALPDRQGRLLEVADQ